MIQNVRDALAALAQGKADATALGVLTDNGCPVNAILACGALLKKLGLRQQLSHAELASLTAAGVDVVKLMGLKNPPPTIAAPAPAAPAPAPAPTLLVPTGETTALGNRVLQAVPVASDDPFAFLLRAAAVEADDERKKALKATYKSLQGQTTSAHARFYRDALRSQGIQIESEADSASRAEARSKIGMSNRVAGTMSRLGLAVRREAVRENLVDEYRAALVAAGIVVTDAQHEAALAQASADATAFAQEAATTLKTLGGF